MAVARVVDVPAASRSYPVLVGGNMTRDVAHGVRELTRASRVALISDSTVAELHAEPLMEALRKEGLEASLLIFPAGEAHKNMETLSTLLEGMAKASLTRDDCVVALGGGVTGDMAGLAAALYLRGIALIQVPTSLLSMVDSAVGGKTAVDIVAGKNLVGAFKQPHLVVEDIELLKTLPPELIADGFGEIIKHGAIADAEMFEVLHTAPLGMVEGFEGFYAEMVARNVAIKRNVVVEDEQEAGSRQFLNFGHTIGHAIEAAQQFQMSHGRCIAIGMCCITRASEALGWSAAGTAQALESCCAVYGLPSTTELGPDTLMEYMLHDKKRHADTMNIAIVPEIGRVELKTVSLEELAHIVELGCKGTA